MEIADGIYNLIIFVLAIYGPSRGVECHACATHAFDGGPAISRLLPAMLAAVDGNATW